MSVLKVEDDLKKKVDQDVRARLQKKLSKQPTKAELQRTNILPSRGSHKLQAVMTQLLKNRLATFLSRNLRDRPTAEKLIRDGILKPEAEFPLSDDTKKTIANFLSQRPSITELLNANVIEDRMQWSRLTAAGDIPHARNCHTVNVIDQCMYLLGGFGGGSRSSELLVMDTGEHTWKKPMVAGVIPQERYSHTCTTLGKHLILFGGYCRREEGEGRWLNDLHVLDTAFKHSFVPTLGAMGASKKAHKCPMLMWYQPETQGDPPRRRAAHTATLVDKTIYIFAGNDGGQLFNDLFTLDTETMQWREPITIGEKPSARAGHTVVYYAGRLIMFGGANAHGPQNDVWEFSLKELTWTKLKASGTPPGPRAGHTANVLTGGKMLIFGGGYLRKVENDLHVLDIEARSWSRPADTGDIPAPRAAHTCDMIGKRLYVFGGGDENARVFNDVHTLDTSIIREMYHAKGKAASPCADEKEEEGPRQLLSLEAAEEISAAITNTVIEVEACITDVESKIQETRRQQKFDEQSIIAIIKEKHRHSEERLGALETEVATLKSSVLDKLDALGQKFSAISRAQSPTSSSAPRPLARPAGLKPPKPTLLGDEGKGDCSQASVQRGVT